MGGGEQVSAVAALFRNGSALSVCREICWRLSASAGGQKAGGEARERPSVTPVAVLVLDGDAGGNISGYSRRLFLVSGTSHSGAANSFSPSELLLCPGSDTEPLDSSLEGRLGRTSSSFPSAVTGKHQVLMQKARGAIFFITFFKTHISVSALVWPWGCWCVGRVPWW